MIQYSHAVITLMCTCTVVFVYVRLAAVNEIRYNLLMPPGDREVMDHNSAERRIAISSYSIFLMIICR